MLYLVARRLTKPRSRRRNVYLNVEVPEEHTGGAVDSLQGILGTYAQSVDIRRLDRRDHTLQLTYLLDCREKDRLAQLADDLTQAMPSAAFSFVDQDSMPV
jgi:hypothetical protein